MISRSDRIPESLARIGLITVVLSPLAFGAVSLGVWVPLSLLWILLGVATVAIRKWKQAHAEAGHFDPLPLPVFLLHALFALQSVPLPATILRTLSPGAFAAHLVPSLDPAAWAPLTASPTGTFQAWLFVAGLHGLVVCVFHADRALQARRLQLLMAGIAGVGGLLALEGLVQAASAHPHWLYGLYKVPGAGVHESGIFGPYYNRDHYSNLMALAGSVSAGILGLALRRVDLRSLSRFTAAEAFPRIIALSVVLALTVVASAAAGSRGGLIALGVGLLIGLGPLLLHRPRLALGLSVSLVILLFATGVPTAFMRLANVDFEASRLLVWNDAIRVMSFFPLAGSGLGAFAVAYWPYQRVVRFEYWPHAHNEYLQWFIETGVLGILLAGYVLRLAWLNAPRLVRSPNTRPALAAFGAMLVHSLVDCVLRIPANAAWATVLAAGLVLVALSAERNHGTSGRSQRALQGGSRPGCEPVSQPHSRTTLETGANGVGRKHGVSIASPEHEPLQLAWGPSKNDAGGPIMAESFTEAEQAGKNVCDEVTITAEPGPVENET